MSGVQQLPGSPCVETPGADLNALRSLGDGRQIQMHPFLLIEDMADQVIDVETLHDDDDDVVDLAVQPRVQRTVVPLLVRLPLGLGEGVGGLQWVVDDDDVTAAPG